MFASTPDKANHVLLPTPSFIIANGGRRGPNLSNVGDRLSRADMVIRILNGGVNMLAYGNNLTPEQLNVLVAFLQSRKQH